MRRIQLLVILAALVALAGVMTQAGSAWGQKDEGKSSQSGTAESAQPQATKSTQSETGENTQAASNAATTDPGYVIGAQDVLDINVWKEKELTETVPVRPDGKISLPLLNDVQAAGLTPSQLADQITKGLKKFVTDPQVTVVVKEILSQRVYLIGEVKRAGAYPLLPGETVLQALSSSGGFTMFANMKKIYVLRAVNGKQEKYPVNYKDVVDGKRPDQDIVLKAGDTIVVP
ncbi:MAG TPA: polysaccharide biosynthesis/export family protein [Candidatus Acidoferrales bacterium]|nr:polysaccharide biosynthesis/export family protein [Candidatus Acidoferrales bacterium]